MEDRTKEIQDMLRDPMVEFTIDYGTRMQKYKGTWPWLQEYLRANPDMELVMRKK